MLRAPLSLVIPLFVIACALDSRASTPDPFLIANGPALRNGHGQGDIVPLRGVNLGGWLLMEPWMCPMDASGLADDWSARDTLTRRFGAATSDSLESAYEDSWMADTDFDHIAAFGMNVIRLPLWYANVQQEDGTWRADAFARLDWAVQRAAQRGIYTILDLHGAPGGQRANADSTGRLWPSAALWTNAVYQARFLDIWNRISLHFAGNPSVAGYDPLNEPIDRPSSSAYWNLLDRCYRTIRTNDPDHVIFMEATCGNWNFNELPAPSTYHWTNVAYQLHLYFWNDWNNSALLNTDNTNALQDWVNHASWNVPCYIGEFNMAPEDAWKSAIELYSGRGASWSMWSYKSTFNGGQTSWGVYNPNGQITAKPTLTNDTVLTISNDWAAWSTTRAFALNPSHRRTLSMPVAKDDAYSLSNGPSLSLPAPGVLANDAHLNLGGAGILLQAIKMADPLHGTLNLATNGAFTYTAAPGYFGPDSFRYKVWDGRIDSVRIATVTLAPPISQTNGIIRTTLAGDGSLNLVIAGTPGARYYLETTTDLSPPVVWSPVPGSTNIVANPGGLWLYSWPPDSTSNTRYFRSVVDP